MATTIMRISFGDGHMNKIGKWRSKLGYPPEKSNELFVRDMFLKSLEENIPEVTP